MLHGLGIAALFDLASEHSPMKPSYLATRRHEWVKEGKRGTHVSAALSRGKLCSRLGCQGSL